ncbi:MAG: hypothetical protein BWX52_01954 [Bacteroidetes bacterium ADurb.Bin013]|nr:MAG: hypothetical protein BWX52_01954 [Bacteroidetes bacterium ADurb.Bin013]
MFIFKHSNRLQAFSVGFRPGSVQNKHQNGCRTDGFQGTFHAQLFNMFLGHFVHLANMPKPGRIDEPEGDPIHHQHIFNGIARGTSHRGYQRLFLAQQGVQQGGFPGVHQSGNGNRDAFFHGISHTERIAKFADAYQQRIHQGA